MLQVKDWHGIDCVGSFKDKKETEKKKAKWKHEEYVNEIGMLERTAYVNRVYWL